MKIAVTYENGEIFQHFGHTEKFKIYQVKDGGVEAAEVVDTMGQGHGALGEFLAERKVDALICGGIGGGAKTALDSQGIALYAGVSGSADEAVEALLAGTLSSSREANCSHHEQAGHQGGHQHACGSHKNGGCGER